MSSGIWLAIRLGALDLEEDARAVLPTNRFLGLLVAFGTGGLSTPSVALMSAFVKLSSNSTETLQRRSDI